MKFKNGHNVLSNFLPTQFDFAHTAIPKKTCFPLSPFLKYSVLMSTVIVFVVGLCSPGLVVTGSISVTGGAGKRNKLFRFTK